MTDSRNRILANVGQSITATGIISSAEAWNTARTITLDGDVSGSVSIDGSENVTLTTTVGSDTVVLGTDTTGNYVATIAGGTGITVTGSGSESSEVTIATTITQYTDSDARNSISVTDSGGDGSLSYNSSTGVLTYTGPSAAEVRTHFSGGTGVTITDGVVAIGQDVGTTSNVTFNDLIVSGNLTVSGTTTTVNTETINLADNIITLNSNEAGTPSQNSGIEVERGTSTNATLLWDEANDYWMAGLSGSEVQIALTNGTYTNLRAQATTKDDVGLGNVENTALSTWAGSTNITTLGTITSGVWNGTAIANANLANSSVSFGGVSVSLGSSDATPAFDLSDATNYPSANIAHDSTTGFVANEHIDHSAVSITAGNGLTGGGDITTSRTLNVGAGTGIDVAADAISVDVSDFMTNGSNNRVLTATGTDAMNAEANLTFDGSTLAVTGDLNVGSGDFFVDDSVGVVAIGTSTPNGGIGKLEMGVDGVGNGIAFYDGTGTSFRIWRDSNVAHLSRGTDSAIAIDSSRNVGIGTTSPGTPLHVTSGTDYSTIRMSRGDSASTTQRVALVYPNYANDAENGLIGGFDNGSDKQLIIGITPSSAGGASPNLIRINTAATYGGTVSEAMRIDSSGNVGIGTTSPSAKVHVSGAGSAAQLRLQRTTSTTTGSFGTLAFANSANANAAYILGSGDGANDSSNISFWTGTSATPTERMRIDSSGNVGIGTTTADGQLGVDIGTTALAAASVTDNKRGTLHLKRQNDATDVTGQIINALSFSGANTGRRRAMIANLQNGTLGTGGDLAFYTSSTAVNVSNDTVIERMRITSDGNIKQLIPAGSENGIIFYDTGNVNRGRLVYNDTSGIVTLSTLTNFPLVFGTNNAERMRIDASGNVMVGKTTTSVGTIGVVAANAGYLGATVDGGTCIFINRLTNDGTLINFEQGNITEGTISVSGTLVSYNGGHLARWAQTEDNSRIEILRGTVMSNLDKMAEWIDPETGEPQENEQLNCMKISDVEGDPNVAGVFVNWDNDDDVFTNDMNIAMTGDLIIRIAEGVSVERGDLLMSAGDGTAKPQGDDIIRSKTIAKVTSTHVTCTYDDGSYCVPCVVMAC